ncbi:MAG: FG-GAP-like repeat-containing protein, partial [Rhodothermales bacterium]
DLDNDGFKDLFVTNGIYHRPNDLDYVRHVSTPAIQASLEGAIDAEDLALLERMPQAPLSNYAFRNNGDLTFTNKAPAWGLDQPGFSNGAVYADLDNDGDLDLVVNNLNAPAALYENHADTRTDHHYLTIILQGEGDNTAGLGARVIVKHAGSQQMVEQAPTRGWISSVDPRLHVGLGAAATVDTLIVVWPDGRYQTLTDVAADQMLTVRQEEAEGTYRYPSAPSDSLFEDVTEALDLDYRHEENAFLDFNRERLMPHLISTEGPAVAVGDVNGDGLEDIYAGGAKWQDARLLLQQSEGDFIPTNEALWHADSLYEDVDAAFFDADGDGDLDLYVVSGGNEFWGRNDALKDRLYRNDGNGAFARAEDALPDLHANGCCVAPADFDGDGDVDLFVGSRVVSRNYGMTPTSYLLENDGAGVFTDATASRAEALAEAGMITDAVWTDTNGDGQLDLIVVGEWMPIRIFEQREGQFVERTNEAGLDGTDGWWNTVEAADLDGDGDVDLIAGNLGLNSSLKTSPDAPVRVYMKDFDANGTLDQMLTTYKNGVAYPLASPDELIQQIPSLAPRYATYADFGDSRLEDIFTPDQLRDALVEEV